jgi:hypothetical protein
LNKIRLAIASAIASVALYGCAPPLPVQHAQFTPVVAEQQKVRFVDSVDIKLSTGYSRRVKSGSLWRLAGQLPQGSVYRPINDVFSVRGQQMHEAWLVVSNDRLVGFYLPGEAHFSPLDPSPSITTQTIHD